MDYNRFNLDKIDFDSEASLNFMMIFLSLFGLGNDTIITVAKEKGTNPLIRAKSALSVIGEAIGFTDIDHKKLLDFYAKQDTIRSRFVRFLTPIFFFLCLLLILTITYYLWRLFDFTVESGVTLFLFSLIYYLTFVISARIFSLLFERYFIETICIDSVFHIVLFLCNDDVLSRPDKKRILLAMTRYLAKRIELLGIVYKNRSVSNLEWIQKHFGKISKYVRERERWIISPTSNTLQDLRDDFYNLASIFVTGYTGDFAWIDDKDEFTIKKDTSLLILIAQRAIRLIGYITPIILIALYLWRPELLPIFTINKETATTVLLAWLLLSIDIGLNLGIVNSVIKFAMDIKDLSKT
jgi:hypothetical protein